MRYLCPLHSILLVMYKHACKPATDVRWQRGVSRTGINQPGPNPRIAFAPSAAPQNDVTILGGGRWSQGGVLTTLPKRQYRYPNVRAAIFCWFPRKHVFAHMTFCSDDESIVRLPGRYFVDYKEGTLGTKGLNESVVFGTCPSCPTVA